MEKGMKQCKHCTTEIPKKAKICPNCKKKQGHGCLSSIAMFFLIFVWSLFFLIRCGSENSSDLSSLEYVSESEIDMVYSNASNYKGKGIVVSGEVFGEPDIDNDEIMFQMYADPQNTEKNTLVVFETNENLSLKDGDYVIVDGMISGVTTYRNILGGKVQAPTIYARNVQIADYVSVVSKTLKTIEVNQTQEQYGYSVAVDKVEFSPIETRVYFTVVNNGGNNVSIYDHNMKIVQDGSQYECQPNWDAEYKSLDSEILPGVTVNAIIPFPVLEQDSGFQIYIDGYSEDWNEEIDTYVFDIAIE